METKKKGITSRNAMCHDCNWTCQDNNKQTYAKARRHCEKEKHYVSVETARVIHYDGYAKGDKSE